MTSGGNSAAQSMSKGAFQNCKFETVVAVLKLQTPHVHHEVVSGCASHCNLLVVQAAIPTSPARLYDVTSTCNNSSLCRYKDCNCKLQPEQMLVLQRAAGRRRRRASKTCEKQWEGQRKGMEGR